MGRTAALTELKAGVPRVALATTRHGPRVVLAYGVLDPLLEHELAREEVEVHARRTIGEVASTLAWRTYDAVVIVPEMPDAIALAKALKLGGVLQGVDEMQPRLAAVRHRGKPVFLLPFRGDEEYAIILRAPDYAYLELAWREPIAAAIARFDATKLLPVIRPD